MLKLEDVGSETSLLLLIIKKHGEKNFRLFPRNCGGAFWPTIFSQLPVLSHIANLDLYINLLFSGILFLGSKDSIRFSAKDL